MSIIVKDWSPLRTNIGKRKRPLYGFVIHATGSGIVTRALDRNQNPNLAVCDYYDEPDANAPHAVVSWLDGEPLRWVIPADGENVDVWVISPDEYRAWHAGISKKWIRRYGEDGGWRCWIKTRDGIEEMPEPDDRYNSWGKRWPNANGPLELVPGNDPNQVCLGVEVVVPVAKTARGGWRRLPFSERQHDATAWWVAQKIAEHEMSHEDRESFCLGHGDLHPVARYAAWGEWDPGAPRYWNWTRFHERLKAYLIELIPPREPQSGPGEHS